jgi:hypothetical protein
MALKPPSTRYRRYLKTLIIASVASLTLCVAFTSFGQSCNSPSLAGTIKDSTGALIPGALVRLDDLPSRKSNAEGAFSFLCVRVGEHTLTISRQGFGDNKQTFQVSKQDKSLQIVLIPFVSVAVEVNGDEDSTSNFTRVGPAQVFQGDRLSELADDPDDLQRELQQLAAAAGGNPADSVITVDGFQDSTKVPPRSSIAYIKVNPDLFSAEYRQPPAGGGRVEIYTKPGQAAFHGDAFVTSSGSWMNAENPFSTNTEPIGKERFGFDLDGPVAHAKSSFALSLEYRSIANTAAVNAFTLNSSGAQVNTLSTVPVPQTRWVGEARFDQQLGPKNTFMIAYYPWRNYMENVGVGGDALQESGYTANQYDDIVRMFDVTTVSPKFMHAVHLGVRFTGESDTPNSSSPQILVSGAFTGGGALLGSQHLKESFSEFDDDATLIVGTHTLKVGVQSFLLVERPQLTSGFNGSYTFGGGTAPVLDSNGVPVSGETTTISGLEQYRRTLLGLAGGSPTVFTNVTGTPSVAYTQVSAAFFAQDEWNVTNKLHISAGLRYYVQNNPLLANGITPRLGVSWGVGKSHIVVLHAHYGLFTGRFNSDDANEWHREDGTERITSTVYSPVYGDPFTGATPIHSVRTLNPHFSNSSQGSGNAGININLKHGWQITGDFFAGRQWNSIRTVNINSPLVYGVPLGPRPLAPDMNILQLQNSGQGHMNSQVMTFSQNKLKRIQFNLGASRVDQIDDNDGNVFFSPQNSLSDTGEFARRSTQPTWHVFGNVLLRLPEDVALSAIVNVSSGLPYNVLTGTDSNGDGDFNDRPEYAAPGTAGAVPTRFGLLTSTGGIGIFPRNAGTMPDTAYLDVNVQRSFRLNGKKQREHKQIVTLNIRSSNVLNATNVTAVGNILGSPQFGSPYAADNGRRVEGGLRYSF